MSPIKVWAIGLAINVRLRSIARLISTNHPSLYRKHAIIVKLDLSVWEREAVCPHLARRLIEITSRPQQTPRALLDWPRAEYAIEQPGNKLLATTELDPDTWVGEVKRIRGKKLPPTAAGVHALRDEYTRTIEPARALAAETLTLERTLSDLVNQACGLTPAEVELMWKSAPPRMPIPRTETR